jgi:cytochrome b561
MRSTLVRTDRYTRGAIAFHWLIAAAVVVNLTIGLAHDAMPRSWSAMSVHKALGITILVLSLARLAWRLTHTPPPLPIAAPAWERLAAKLAHWLLYALTILVPLTGWMMVSNPERVRPLDWFGLFPLPFLPVTPGVAGGAAEAHELLAFALLGLAVLHTLAALRHHLLLRDSTLVRMLPILRVPTAR